MEILTAQYNSVQKALTDLQQLWKVCCYWNWCIGVSEWELQKGEGQEQKRWADLASGVWDGWAPGWLNTKGVGDVRQTRKEDRTTARAHISEAGSDCLRSDKKFLNGSCDYIKWSEKNTQRFPVKGKLLW